MKTKIGSVIIFLIVFLSTHFVANAQNAENIPANSLSGINTSAEISIAFMISILLLKITAFILGYLIVKLGHDTLIKGITGDFDFGFSGSGFNTKLKSASPGLFFVFMGSAIIIWSMVVDKPLKIATTPSTTIETKEQKSETEMKEEKDEIPDSETLDTTEHLRTN